MENVGFSQRGPGRERGWLVPAGEERLWLFQPCLDAPGKRTYPYQPLAKLAVGTAELTILSFAVANYGAEGLGSALK